MVEQLAKVYGVSQVCRILGLARSTFYYESHERADTPCFERALLAQAGKHPVEGSRRLAARLRRQKRWVHTSRERVRRAMGRLGIVRKNRRKRRYTTNSQHGFRRYPNLVKDLLIDHPHQVWVCDITAIKLADGCEVYLAIIMDVFTRKIVGWALRRDLTHELSLSALLRALHTAIPEIHHSDQGVQYANQHYVDYLDQAHARISMAAVGKAWENGYAERVLGTIKQEEVELSEYRTFADALRQLGHFIDSVYNRKRIHSALGYLTPSEFEAEWRAQTTVNHTP
jgi:transposase InsO family protein